MKPSLTSTFCSAILRFASLLLVCAGTIGCQKLDDAPDAASKPHPEVRALNENPPTKIAIGHPAEKQPIASVEYQSQLRFASLNPEQFPEIIPRNGEEANYSTILESLGSGCAAFDYDRDGWPDAIIAGGGHFDGRKAVANPLAVLRNQRTTFVDCSIQQKFPEVLFYNHGLTMGDYDQDGFEDLLLAGFKGIQLFRNMGDGTFESVSDTTLNSPFWNTSAAWLDVNRDSILDLFVATYVDWSFENDPPCYARDNVTRDNCSPKQFQPHPNQLFLGNGDGSFRNATKSFGLRNDGKTLGVVAGDIDGDGFVDLYIGNDVMSNFLYRNDSGNTFIDQTSISGAGVSRRGTPDASMGVNIADFDRDGRLDLWSANFEHESFAVYRQQAPMMFRHASDTTGVAAIGSKYVGWGSVFADFDLDGDEDMVVANGHVVKHPDHAPVKQRMVLLENVDSEYFEEVGFQAGSELATPRNGRGLAKIDWNRDGRPDLLASPVNSPCLLLENRTPTQGHWLKLTLVGTKSPRTPIGASVRTTSSTGPIIQLLKGGGSYASASEPTITLTGLDSAIETLITIRWPSGIQHELSTSLIDTHLVVVEPADAHTTVFEVAASQ